MLMDSTNVHLQHHKESFRSKKRQKVIKKALPIKETSFLWLAAPSALMTALPDNMSNSCWAKSSHCDSSGKVLAILRDKMVDVPVVIVDWLLKSSSSSSSNGIVQEDTIEAERSEARLELPELEAEDTEETVDIVEIGDIVEARPLKELSPLSLLLWLCEVAWFPLHMEGGCVTTGLAMNPRGIPSSTGWTGGICGRLRLSRLFFHRIPLELEPTEIFACGSEVVERGESWGCCSRDGVLLEWIPRFLGAGIKTSEELGTVSSKDDSNKPLAEVRGFGGGTGGRFCCCLCCCCCLLSFWTSSEVNCMVEVLPPKNFSHPGAPVQNWEV